MRSASRTDAPPNGYFFGYRIDRAWYERAPDREAALYEMLRLRDPARFLGESGYHPR